MKEQALQFDGGMTPDLRRALKNQNVYSYIENFDPRNDVTRLAPNFSISKDAGSYTTTDNVTTFAYDPNSAGVFGLGDQKLKQLSTPFGSPSWSTLVNGFDGSLHPANKEGGLLFSANYLYWIYNFKTIARYGDLSGSPSFNGTYASLANSAQNITAPLTMGKDANIYFGIVDNTGAPQLVQLTGGSLVVKGLIPSQYRLVSICQYGNYLALGCSTTDISKQSLIFLWDYSSTDITEVIQCGNDKLRGIENVEGGILIVSETVDPNQTRKELSFKYYAGSTKPLLTVRGQDSSYPFFYTTPINYALRIRTQNNIAYFPVQFTFDTGSHLSYKYGIAKFGRRDTNSPLSFTVDICAGTETGEIWDAFYAGRYVIYSTFTDSTHSSIFTSSTAGYLTAKFETIIYNGGDVTLQKKLEAFATYCEPLTSGQSIAVSYRKEGETSWTLMYTHNTVGETSHVGVNIESTGDNFPDFAEIQFKIVSTAGAVFLGYKWKAGITTSDVYGQ